MERSATATENNHFEEGCRMKRVQEIGDGEDEEEESLAIESVNIVKGKVYEMCLL